MSASAYWASASPWSVSGRRIRRTVALSPLLCAAMASNGSAITGIAAHMTKRKTAANSGGRTRVMVFWIDLVPVWPQLRCGMNRQLKAPAFGERRLRVHLRYPADESPRLLFDRVATPRAGEKKE